MTSDIASYLIEILAAVSTAGVARLLWMVGDIRKQVYIINGRIGKLEEWRLGKEKLDDERWKIENRRFDQLERRNKGGS